MGHVALQRVVVRMLFDAPFAAAVYADPARALGAVALTETERAWLVAGDRRAYGTDPLRRHRALQALLEEHPVSAAVLALDGFPVRGHDAFFSGPRFHAAIQHRGALVEAFGEHLAALACAPLAVGVVALERAVAEARRGQATPWAAGATVRLAGGVRVARVPAGSLDAFAALGDALRLGGTPPIARLLRGALALPQVTIDPQREEQVLVVGPGADVDDNGAALSFATDELATLLEAVAPTATRDALGAILGSLGLAPEEAGELLDELVADGLLEVRAL